MTRSAITPPTGPVPACPESDAWQRVEIGPYAGCYLVWSRSKPHYAYLLDAAGRHLDEGCTASCYGRACWHSQLVRTLEEQRAEAEALARHAAEQADGTQWDQACEAIASRANPPAACLEPERPVLTIVPPADPFEAIESEPRPAARPVSAAPTGETWAAYMGFA